MRALLLKLLLLPFPDVQKRPMGAGLSAISVLRGSNELDEMLAGAGEENPAKGFGQVICKYDGA
eukprot:1939796-Prorocentrum_lima.AAC.1